MTIKGSKSSSPRTTIVVPDSAGLTFPNSDWSVGVRVFMDGTVTGDVQYIFRTGEYGNGGGLIFAYSPNGSANPGRFMAYVNGSGSVNAQTGASVEAGKAYVIVLRRVNGIVRTAMCPILQTEPTDSSAVILNTAIGGQDQTGLNVAMDGPLDMWIGNRNDGNRGFDNSFDRLFRIDRALTDLEIAQLAYGKEITDFGTPAWYFKFKSTLDTGDYGPSSFTTTVNGPYTNGTPITSGYTAPTTDVAPAITGAPTIIGSAQVSQSISYTPAGISGNPAPTRTQQWYIDGVAISGATAATYIPVTADIGKTLTVKQTASNTVGTASATSPGVVVAAAANAIAYSAIAAERVFQRIGSAASIPFSGTYTGTQPSKIEYQLYRSDGTTVVLPWADMAASIVAGGTWSASLSVQQALYKYRIALRSKDSAGAVLSTLAVSNKFGVGDIIIGAGSSSAYTWFISGSGTQFVPDTETTSYYDSNGWRNMDNNGVATDMSKYFAQQLGVVVAMANCGLSGDSLINWTDKNHPSWLQFANAITAMGGKISGVFASMGSNDAANNYKVTSRASHLANIRTIIANTRTLTGQPNLPFLWSGYNRRLDGYNPMSDWVRMAEADVGDDPYVYHAQMLDMELGGDGVHLTMPGFQAQAARLEYVWIQAYKNNTYLRGPKITSMTYSGSNARINLQHRGSSDFTPISNITGFVVTDADASGVVPTVTSAVHTDANTITLGFSRALVQPAKITYLAGNAPPVGTPVYGNTSSPLPMTVEADMVATYQTVTPTVTGVVVTPASATIQGAATQQFSAVVNGTNGPSQGVTWSATAGSISSAGLFTAPASSTSAQSVTVTATSTADTTQKGTATVTVPAVVPIPTVTAVTVSPSTATIAGGGAQQFTASVTGTNSPSQSVTWSASTGTINAAGLFVGPPSTASAQVVTITATSTLDGQKKGTAAVTVQATVQVPDNPVPVDFVPSASRTIKVRAGSLGFTGGPFWDMSNPFRPVGRMDPDSIIDVTFDWSEVLADIKSSLANVEFNLSGGLGTDKFVSGSQATVLVTRNGTGQISITSRITTASNPIRRMDATVLLKVEDL